MLVIIQVLTDLVIFFVRSVFWALFGVIYLCFGMPEVYRVLFEVFGLDPEAEDCQPKMRRQLEDVDYVSVEFDSRKLSWQDVAAYRVIVSSPLFLNFLLIFNLEANMIFILNFFKITVIFCSLSLQATLLFFCANFLNYSYHYFT